MTVSLFAVRAVASLGMLLATTAPGFAQGNLTKLSSEYSLGGSMPGPQAHAHLSVNSTGGYVVWEDLRADGNEMGVMALGLDSHFQAKGSPFRVNQYRAGNQERPKAALLDNGGSVFVWQGGNLRRQHIYARFMDANNSWLGGDLLVSSADFHQVAPSLAKLKNGNVVVVYQSYNQRGLGSQFDVYARILGPNGQAVDIELPINQVITFAQRAPAVAALPNGGFVVVWVGEQQRSEDSIDIFGRFLKSDGTPAGTEFLVNTGTNVCANPSVAVANDGSFLVGWSEHFADRNIRWEVVTRAFGPDGSAGLESRINTHRRNDQMGPQIAALGDRFLVVWTSMGQDKFNEGVYGRVLTGSGSPVGEEFQVHTQVLSRQILPTLASDGAARLLVAWSSLLGGIRNNLDLQAQKIAPEGYAEPALAANKYGPPVGGDSYPMDPAPGQVDPGEKSWDNWIAGLPKLISPEPTSTPGGGGGLAGAAGAYYGLIADPQGVKPESSGFISAALKSSGAFSARVMLGKSAISLSGKVDATGAASRTVASSRGGPAITVDLKFDLNGAEHLSGTISLNGATSEIAADKLVYNGKSSRAPQAGVYTVLWQGQGLSLGASPAGEGYATVSVNTRGQVAVSGKLADGIPFTQRSAVSRNGDWPLYAPLYAGKGMLQSWMQFEDDSDDDDVEGQAIWIKQNGASSAVYRTGFTNEIAAVGSRYTAPASNQRVVPIEQGQVIASSAGVVVTNNFQLALNNKVAPASQSLSMAISSKNGLFRGSFRDPASNRAYPFQGVFNKKRGIGAGFFMKDNQSGHVYVGPAQ